MIEVAREILQLPQQALIDRAMPKAFFEKHFKLTPGEKRLLNIPFLPLKSSWIAELNSKTLNIPSFENPTESYIRIPVFVVQFSAEHWETQLDKILNLYHKHIPFPVLLFAHTSEEYVLGAATKSINQADKMKRVLEQQYTTPKISLKLKSEPETKFRESLAFTQLNRVNLKTLYDSYIAAIVNYRRAIQIGSFEVRKEVKVLNDNLDEIQVLEKEMRILKNKLMKAKQVREKVDLQMKFQELKKRKTELEKTL